MNLNNIKKITKNTIKGVKNKKGESVIIGGNW